MASVDRDAITVLFLCPRCLSPWAEAGRCANCGTEVVGCQPGNPDDPGRKPLMTRGGMVKARAPQWWLCHTVTRLIEIVEQADPGSG